MLLLTGVKFIPEIHLRQPAMLGKPGFRYNACRPLTRNTNTKIYRDRIFRINLSKRSRQGLFST